MVLYLLLNTLLQTICVKLHGLYKACNIVPQLLMGEMMEKMYGPQPNSVNIHLVTNATA